MAAPAFAQVVEERSVFHVYDTVTGLPDGASRLFPIQINDAPNGAVVSGIEVGLDIFHTYHGDLFISLRGDNESTPNFAELPDHFGNGQLSVVYNDDQVPSLKRYIGEEVNRTWYLFVQDFLAADSGWINGWTIKVSYEVRINAPQINQVLPVEAKDGNTQVTLTGRAMNAPLTVKLINDATGEAFFPRILLNLGSRVIASHNFGGEPGSWRAVVKSGEQISNERPFEVLVTPTVSAVNPSAAAATGAAEQFRIVGANFGLTAGVSLENTTTGETFNDVNVQSISPGEILVSHNFGSVDGEWKAFVSNRVGNNTLLSADPYPFQALASDVPVDPSINIARTANGVRLSWTGGTEWKLRSAESLTAEATWADVADAPVAEGDGFYVDLSVATASNYFRLSNQ